jgi:hypothetical protein
MDRGNKGGQFGSGIKHIPDLLHEFGIHFVQIASHSVYRFAILDRFLQSKPCSFSHVQTKEDRGYEEACDGALRGVIFVLA